jgi:RimJ/RimL family protein N-acetyltransferase
MNTIFTTDGYNIKTFTIDNFDSFCELNQDPVVSKYVNHNNGKPKTFRECVEKYDDITHAQNKHGYSYWAVYDMNDNFIGQCGALRSWVGEINFCYAFHKQYWGRGIGTKVCALVLDYLFKNFETIDKITCSAFTENIASVKLLKKIGFSYLYTKKEFNEDLEFFEITRESYEKKKNN